MLQSAQLFPCNSTYIVLYQHAWSTVRTGVAGNAIPRYFTSDLMPEACLPGEGSDVAEVLCMDWPAACLGEDLALRREGLRQGAGAVGSSSALGMPGCCCSRNAFRSCLLLAPGRNHLLTSALGACVQDLSDSRTVCSGPYRGRP